MGRGDLRHVSASLTSGINQQPEGAFLSECADARDVWLPNRIELRPGVIGVMRLNPEAVSGATNLAVAIRKSGVFTSGYPVNFAGSAVGDAWYFGVNHSNISLFRSVNIGNVLAGDPRNTNVGTYYDLHYSLGGGEWGSLQCADLRWKQSAGGAPKLHTHLADEATQFYIVPPADWAEDTVDSVTRYWLRWTILGVAVASCAFNLTLLGCSDMQVGNFEVHGLFSVAFPGSRRLLYHYTDYSRSETVVEQFFGLPYKATRTNNTITRIPYGLATCAVVPEYKEAYIACDGVVTRHPYNYDDTPNVNGNTEREDINASVESDDLFVGTGSVYDRNYILQEGAFPPAKFIMHFKGRLWASGLIGQPNTVQWSEPQEFYRIWPLQNKEPLMEDDNSAITGMATIGELPVIFKRDSIWTMSSVGEDEFGLEHFVPTKVVNGVGTVSHWSIQKVRGQLVFLYEDGIYRFDGTPNVKKVTLRGQPGRSDTTDRLSDTIGQLYKGKLSDTVAVNWRSQSLYLLAVSINGSATNNLVIVWDYDGDTWWLWDLSVRFWLLDESEDDYERLGFVDDKGDFYVVGSGRTDHGAAINPYVTTQRAGYRSNTRNVLRQVEVTGSARNGTISLDIWADDNELRPTSGSIAFADQNDDGTISRRARRVGARVLGDHQQVKLSQGAKNGYFDVAMIDMGFGPPRRR